MISSPIWLPATLLAGLVQAWRTALQKRVSTGLSVNAAGLVRYFYGLPCAILLLALYLAWRPDNPLPAIGPMTLPMVASAAISQILGTNLLLMAFAERNFVVGTAYSKTEAVQGALLSNLLLGERLSWLSWCGIGAGLLGVLILSLRGTLSGWRGLVQGLGQRVALYGIGSGFLFAVTSVSVRRATLDVASADRILAALVVLVLTIFLQTLLQGSYVLWREREQIAPLLAGWRVSGQVGLLSAVGSAFWFTGFAMAPVALVRIVGQVEVLFTLGFSHFYLGERASFSEIFGLVLVAAGVVLALVGTMNL